MKINVFKDHLAFLMYYKSYMIKYLIIVLIAYSFYLGVKDDHYFAKYYKTENGVSFVVTAPRLLGIQWGVFRFFYGSSYLLCLPTDPYDQSFVWISHKNDFSKKYGS